MKKKFWILVLMAVTLVVASCSKDDEDRIPDGYVGTWTCHYYCLYDDEQRWHPIPNEEDDYTPTTVTMNQNGTGSGSGMLLNGNFTLEIGYETTAGNVYSAIVIFHGEEKNDSAALRVYPYNDERAFVYTAKHPCQWFIFEKEK